MIPFNRPTPVGDELGYGWEAIQNGHLSGNGPYTRRCTEWLREQTGAQGVLPTHSATGALEMAVTLLDIGPGDEVIMPSFTFVSCANAVVRAGGVPMFVDVRSDTLNLDETLVAAAVTERTQAIMPTHYAGVGCDMDALRSHGIPIIEDAAQGIMATWNGRPLGAIGELGALSFHETKNVQCGEGGALLVNDPALMERAEIIHEKGTDRSRFHRGQVDKYRWQDVGSSYVLSDLAAAFLYGQLEHAEAVTADRLRTWNAYHEALAPREDDSLLRRPVVPAGARHNGHIYYVLLPDLAARTAFIAGLASRGVVAVHHYVPLHSSPAGRRYGRAHGDLGVTDDVADRLARLPLWFGMGESEVEQVVDAVLSALDRKWTTV